MIPTAEDFLKSFIKEPTDTEIQLCVEFAKLHAVAALKAASKSKYKWHPNCGKIHHSEQAKNAILSSYPLTNIK